MPVESHASRELESCDAGEFIVALVGFHPGPELLQLLSYMAELRIQI